MPSRLGAALPDGPRANPTPTFGTSPLLIGPLALSGAVATSANVHDGCELGVPTPMAPLVWAPPTARQERRHAHQGPHGPFLSGLGEADVSAANKKRSSLGRG